MLVAGSAILGVAVCLGTFRWIFSHRSAADPRSTMTRPNELAQSPRDGGSNARDQSAAPDDQAEQIVQSGVKVASTDPHVARGDSEVGGPGEPQAPVTKSQPPNGPAAGDAHQRHAASSNRSGAQNPSQAPAAEDIRERLPALASRPGAATARGSTASLTPSHSRIDWETRYKPIARPPQPVDVRQRLADSMPSIDVRHMPLVEFLRLISQFSTIPIALQPESLSMAGLAATEPVSASHHNATVQNILDSALQPKRLAYEIVDGYLIVGSHYAIDRRLRRMEHSASDLVGGDPQRLVALVDDLHRLVAPTSWQRQGGMGTLAAESDKLIVVQTADVHYQLYTFCEKLRMARGLPSRRRAGQEHFRLDTRTARARAKLDLPLRIRCETDTRFIEILRRLEKLTAVTLLVDWQAVAPLGWSPETTMTLVLEDVTRDEALGSLLSPMDLTYRAVDEGTLEITTRQALAEHPELEFYAVGDLTDNRTGRSVEGAQLIERLAELLSDQPLPPETGLAFDPQSQCLMALLPQPQQRTVADLLEHWRSQ